MIQSRYHRRHVLLLFQVNSLPPLSMQNIKQGPQLLGSWGRLCCGIAIFNLVNNDPIGGLYYSP